MSRLSQLRKLDALADEFIADCIDAHNTGKPRPEAYSLAVRMKQIIGTYTYGPSPFTERKTDEQDT